jgi:hypothetical protein
MVTEEDPPSQSRVFISHLRAAGEWAKAPVAADFASVQPALEACWSPRDAGVMPAFNLGLDEDGRVTRCERWTTRSSPGTPFHDCVCGALRGARLAPGKWRRLQLTVDSTFPHRATVAGRPLYARIAEVRSTDRFAAWAGPAAVTQLDSCFAAAPPAGRDAIPVRWSVDASGQVVGLDVDLPHHLAQSRDCLLQKLRAARFPCPLAGSTASVTGRIEVHLGKRAPAP